MDDTKLTGESVRGDLLSCYSTAVAGALHRSGLPYEALLGCQLFLGVRRSGAVLEMLHHHTPLTGDRILYRLPMSRRGAAGAAEAGAGIAAEAARRGVVIVTGATPTLPWIVTTGVEPAPHWFLATCSPATASTAAELAVSDVFTWVDDAGEHPGFEGRLGVRQIGELALSPYPVSDAALSRERWALGVRRERPERTDDRRWQWIEIGPAWVAGADLPETMATVFARTVAGAIVDPGVAAEGWRTGAAAFTAIAETVDAGRDDLATYTIHNDLWVASRGRQLFAHALRAGAGAGVGRSLPDLADRVERDLLPAWSNLVRALRYNAIRLQRGSSPRMDVLSQLDRISVLEQEVRERLATGLTASV